MTIPAEELRAVLPGLEKVSEHAVAQLARGASLRRYRTKVVLYRAGEVADGLYVVMAGRVIVRRETAERSEMLHTERAGGVLGEIPVFGGGRFPATAVALEPTECCHIPVAVVERLLRDEPSFARFALSRMAARAQSLLRRIDELTASTVTTRIAAFVAARAAQSKSPDFTLGMTQSELADELGTAREVIVRGIARLVDAGAIARTGRSRFAVRRLATLRAVAGLTVALTLCCLGACSSRPVAGGDSLADADATRASRSAPISTRGVPSCFARATSMTPPGWQVASSTPRTSPESRSTLALRQVAELPLPGPANRFDYQSVDPVARRLYLSHMNAGRLLVFDLDSSRMVREVPGLDRATGVWAVPSHHAVYVSAAGRHEVAVVDDRTFAVLARVGGVRFPDGIAFAPDADKVFVSDESGGADVVIDARSLTKRATIPLDGEAGNTHYDSVSKCVLVAVQTRGQLVAIDPATERVVARYDVPGVDGPHGFTLDEPGRLAFVTGEGNAALAVMDLRTMRVVQSLRVGDDPDVLAWDPELRRLYVASESGVLASFRLSGDTLLPIGELRAPHAHTVSVDPRTHRVYLPLENVGGRPVLRVLEPAR